MSIKKDLTLFSAETADGNSDAVEWHGGRGVFSVWGTFGSGTCKLQWSPDGGVSTWIDVDASGDTYVTLTANGVGGFELPWGFIRAALSGSTSASVNAAIGGTT